jgi:hypothetical protein
VNELLVILVFVAGTALVLALVFLSYKAEKERREALAAWAAFRGWSFDPDADHAHDDEFPQFELFRRGHSRRAYNTVRGSLIIAGHHYAIKCGDYLYKVTRSNGKRSSTSTYRFSYAILTLPFPGVPGLEVRREGLFDKFTQALGFDDIDFESAEFSRRFCVKGTDKRFAYDLITPAMMEFLLAEEPSPVAISRGQQCLTDGRTRWAVPQFTDRLGWAERFFQLWPEHLIRSLAEGGYRS